VYLADTLGEADQLAKGAQWVFVGGSLVDCGGHNMLEPAMWGKKVVCGPYTQVVEDDVAWLSELNVLRQAQGVETAAAIFAEMLSNQVSDTVVVAATMQAVSEQLLDDYLALCVNAVERGRKTLTSAIDDSP